MSSARIDAAFEHEKKALVAYVMAGFPTPKKSAEALQALAENGADIIELGFPFSDPVADGPVIQRAAHQAIAQGVHLASVLEMVRQFRVHNQKTALILMGYYNPILQYGEAQFFADAAAAGVDGFILVDVPTEEDAEILTHCQTHAMSLIKLTTPTTSKARAQTVLQGASGFVYYVSVKGITGGQKAAIEDVKTRVDMLKTVTNSPVCVGFGIKTPDDAASFASVADGVVVGTALLDILEKEGLDAAIEFIRSLKAVL